MYLNTSELRSTRSNWQMFVCILVSGSITGGSSQGWRKVKSWFTDRDRCSLLFSSVQLCNRHMGTFPLQEELCVIFTLSMYSVAADRCWNHYNLTGLTCYCQTHHVACIIKCLVCLASLATRINSCFLISSEVSLVFVLGVGIITVSDVIVTLWQFFCHKVHQKAQRSCLGWYMWHWWWFLFTEEDRYDSYSRMLLKYFLSEGVVCGHELFLASARDHPDEIMQVWRKSNQVFTLCLFDTLVRFFGSVNSKYIKIHYLQLYYFYITSTWLSKQ